MKRHAGLPRCPGLCCLFVFLLAGRAAADPGEQALTLDTPGGTITGTLLMPDGAGKPPVALIIAGSGPTDRDGNSTLPGLHNDSLKLLAGALGRQGIASLRYDKRGIGASRTAMTSESALRFDDYVTDAAAWLAQIKSDPRFSKVVVIGHSEGFWRPRPRAVEVQPGRAMFAVPGQTRRGNSRDASMQPPSA